jgi:hypothetical protein
MTLDSTTYAALALVLTLLGAGWTWLSWRRRGAAAAVRGLAWTLVPVALWLTGTLRLVLDVADDVGRWASRLAFSPSVWLGVALAGAAVVLWFVSGLMLGRGIGVRGPAARPDEPKPKAGPKQVSRKGDDDVEGMDEIEAILKKHGI